MRRSKRYTLGAATIMACVTLVSCNSSGFDVDLRQNQYGTSEAVQGVLLKRPKPDARGIITYSNYQVAIARFGDTLDTLATRIGVDAESLANYNEMKTSERLRAGEVIALPGKIASTETAFVEGLVDVAEIAKNALDETVPARPTTQKSTTPQNQVNATEPIRHKVKRGETAFTISRLYNVSIRSLAEWNALDADFTIREGQYLLIPLNNGVPPTQVVLIRPREKPGDGSVTPTPPSAKSPLPEDELTQETTLSAKETSKISTPNGGQFTYPVKGKIIREYVKNKTDGIDLSAAPGSTIVAAQSGTVAAITADADQVPIVVIKHADNLLTVYANVADISVKKGASVTRGQPIGKVRDGNPAYLHFEVRNGFESVDPMDYLR